ncbi:hypothetical protein, partial [Acinetobacter nectaris]|uniref:hypothetical protein n=1 Tax=Acinetobacter nectaris TaxID=1219382 RepID=UPI001F45784B
YLRCKRSFTAKTELCSNRGIVHDFELFKRNLKQTPVGACIIADKGYQGVSAIFKNCLFVAIKSKKRL